MKKINVGSDFSGVGAFNQALKRIKEFQFNHVFACDMDKYARQSYLANYEKPEYYPENVYEREIPTDSLDIYMTSPPCQSFSLAGKRKGKDSENGILFFNSHEFIQKNKPRFFIFENVKGLLSDDNGNTFKEWLNMLGGKTVNGNPIIFPFENSVPYHIYFKVLNSKKHGVPQNRERVFIVGIRDDIDNVFTWPKEEYLSKKLKDVLESDVPEKYFLSDKLTHTLFETSSGKDGQFKPASCKDVNGVSNALTARMAKMGRGDNYLKVKVKSATSKGYETATENDSINFTHPESKTRRGRVGKEVAQTLDTSCNQGIIQLNNPKHSNDRVYSENGCGPTLNTMQGGNRQPFVCIPVLTPDRKEKRQNGRRFKEDGEEMFTITTQDRHGVFDGFKIRKLTPRECFRLQDFPDDFKFVVSDSQLYKQAGNSITVRVLELIIRKLKL